MPTEHPTPTPTGDPVPRPPPSTRPGPPTETPETPRKAPRREPADGNAPTRSTLAYGPHVPDRPRVVASIVGLLADVPEGLDRHEVEAHVHWRTEEGPPRRSGTRSPSSPEPA